MSNPAPQQSGNLLDQIANTAGNYMLKETKKAADNLGAVDTGSMYKKSISIFRGADNAAMQADAVSNQATQSR